MTRQKFVQQYLEPSTLSAVATRRFTEEEKRKFVGSLAVDFHADKATNKE